MALTAFSSSSSSSSSLRCRIFFGKNKVMMVALGREPSSEYRENLHQVGGSAGNRSSAAVRGWWRGVASVVWHCGLLGVVVMVFNSLNNCECQCCLSTSVLLSRRSAST